MEKNKSKAIKPANIKQKINIQETFFSDVRHNMAVQYMLSAAYFTRQCFSIEKCGNKAEQMKDVYYSTAAINASFSSIESAINEFYQDAIDRNSNLAEKIDEESLSLLASHWNTIKKSETLEKYQWALFCVRKPPFDKSREPFQAIDNLRYLRNELVHFKPEWESERRNHTKIEKRLKAYKFQPNPFIPSGNSYFPLKCLGHGCAEWAVKSALKFIESFRTKLLISPMFNTQTNNFSTR